METPSPPASPPPPAPPPLLVPEAVFAAIRGREVVLTTRTGGHLRAVILASDGDALIVATVPTGQVTVVPKAEIFDVRVMLAPPVTEFPRRETRFDLEEQPPPPPLKPLPPSTRYFGLQLGLPPSLMVDLDYGYFLGFANVSIFLPLLTATTAETGEPFGGFSTSHLWAFTIGTGATFRLSPFSRWHFDIFGTGGGSNWNPSSNVAVTYAAFGLGMGFHVTLDGGFTFAIKGPLVGGATGGSSLGNSTSALGTYFLSSLVGLPLASFGYRF